MQIYADPSDMAPLVEGDRVQCVRVLLAHCTPRELSQILRDLRLTRAARAEQLQEQRALRGLTPLKVFEPAPEPDEAPVAVLAGAPAALGLTEYFIDEESGELWCEDDEIELAPERPAEDGDTMLMIEAEKVAVQQYATLLGRGDAE